MRRLSALFAALLVAGCATHQPATPAELRQQVADAERAFAQTMARRDHAAFTRFLADETVFFARDRPLRGKAAVAEAWKPFFEPAQAPFSWDPTVVEVLDSGTLALTSGPVLDPSGRQIGGFNSIWRRERDGQWRIVFDKGCDVCPVQR